MLVSIIVPAYKQEKTIQKDIKNIYNTMLQTRWDFEIIVVVDGFVDKTYENAKKLEKHSEISVIGYKKNWGKGYAIRYGMARAVGDLIAFIDAGMDIDPNGISMILEHMQWYKADVIVGSKRHPASKVEYPWFRSFYSWGYHTMVRLLFGLSIKDTQTGLKVFRREVLEEALPRLLVKQFAFDIELLSVIRRLGHKRIFESPVILSWEFSKGTNFNRFLFLDSNIRGMLVDTAAVFYRMHIKKYYDDHNKRIWEYDPALDMMINTGKMGNMTNGRTPEELKDIEEFINDDPILVDEEEIETELMNDLGKDSK
jgi:glycosyltransferase involved in cell wall biosynthesis